ncbi:MAG: hypothetical protein JW917_11635 [Ignavibacteria bacterium]|nr:hypothetical protein [Ignavibacteria bacterium]
MKLFKIIFLTAILAIVPLSMTNAKDISAATKSDLDIQIYEEIKDVLNEPVYLAYSDKNLKGISFVTVNIADNGKIYVSYIRGENHILNEYLSKKVSSRNLWTDPVYSNSSFTYKIRMI